MATSIVKRYAKAIVELAIENNNSSTWVNNFDDAHTFLSNRDLFAFLTSPQVPQMEKFKSIDPSTSTLSIIKTFSSERLLVNEINKNIVAVKIIKI